MNIKDKNILIVEDEKDIADLMSYHLSREGVNPFVVNCGEAVKNQIEKSKPDLVVLDIMLPGIDGIEVCSLLKSNVNTKNIPVLIVSARGEEKDIVSGLEKGADDYITKPFSPKILVTRIKTIFRRIQEKQISSEALGEMKLEKHGIFIDPLRYEVKVNGKDVVLTATEFKILHHLLMFTGRVFTRYQIVKAVHGNDYPVTDRSIDVQVVGLRKKLGDLGGLIETVRAVGYRIKE